MGALRSGATGWCPTLPGSSPRPTPGLHGISMVEATRTVSEKTSVEQRYYLTSLTDDAQQFGEAVRGHWGVENGLHWVLDVTFAEDQSRLRREYATENFAVLLHLALSLLRQEPSWRNRIKLNRLKTGWDDAYLTKVLFRPN